MAARSSSISWGVGPHQLPRDGFIRVFPEAVLSARAYLGRQLIAQPPGAKDDASRRSILSLKARRHMGRGDESAGVRFVHRLLCVLSGAFPLDDCLVRRGTHRAAALARRPAVRHEGVDGVLFAVWAPQATRVSIVGDFNRWDGRRFDAGRVDSGLWEIFVPDLTVGAVYGFELFGPERAPCRSRRFRSASRLNFRPSTASVVADSAHFACDRRRLHGGARKGEPGKPMSIYEAHLGSWRRGEGGVSDLRRAGRTVRPLRRRTGYTL